MVSAAHPCRHLWPWNMAGIKLMYFVSCKIMSMCPRFVVVGGTQMLLFCVSAGETTSVEDGADR